MIDTMPVQAVRGRYRETLRTLAGRQKPARDTAAYSRLVNRPLAARVAALAWLLGMTPGMATAVSATLSASGIALLALAGPEVWSGLLVAVLLATGYVMDSVDGQLARLGGGGTLHGEWLDHTVDCFKTALVHIAVLIHFYRHPPVPSEAALAVPLAFEVIQVVTYFGLILMPLLRRKGADLTGGTAPDTTQTRREHWLRKWLILPTDYGVLCWVFVLLAWPAVFLFSYTFLAAVNAAALAWALGKWWRELRSLDEARGSTT